MKWGRRRDHAKAARNWSILRNRPHLQLVFILLVTFFACNKWILRLHWLSLVGEFKSGQVSIRNALSFLVVVQHLATARAVNLLLSFSMMLYWIFFSWQAQKKIRRLIGVQPQLHWRAIKSKKGLRGDQPNRYFVVYDVVNGSMCVGENNTNVQNSILTDELFTTFPLHSHPTRPSSKASGKLKIL